MPIIGFTFTEISGNRLNPIKGQINLKKDLKITSVEKESMNISSTDDTLKFEFKFSVDYVPEIGNITLKGNVLYMTDPKVAKTILNDWKKDKKINDDRLLLSLLNTIIARANVKSLVMAEELNLPPHIKMPRVTKSPKNSR